MKKILLLIAIAGLFLSTKSMAQVTLDFESGNRSIEQGNCWVFGSVSYSNLEFRINGFWSGRTNQLSNPAITASWIKTPWLKPGSGNITLKARLENSSGLSRGIVLSYIPYDPNSNTSYKEGATTTFSTYNFPTPLNIWVQDLTFAIPAEIANSSSSYKILISFVGQGGNSRAFVDDIVIPGTYNSNPSNNCLPTVTIADQDNDGVADADDAYPADKYRAYNTYYPSENTRGTLAFEDLWPAKGDYDFNDVVVDYRMQKVTNADNKIVEVYGNFDLRASGGVFNNGFGFQLDGIKSDKIISATGNSIGGNSIYSFASNGLEKNQTFANYIVFDDSHRLLGNNIFNTDPEAASTDPVSLNVHLVFMENGVAAPGGALSTSSLNAEDFNFYIVTETKTGEILEGNVQPTFQDRGKEIHMPGFEPTDLVDETLFGTLDDDSGSGNYYKTANNLPWGLNIIQGLDYPIEKRAINEAYHHFIEWAESEGSSYPDWYADKPGYRDTTKIY